jgi:2-polyprenyl-6-methoxyphenol hydroxylase-like FAD-dependent oxidoreductase
VTRPEAPVGIVGAGPIGLACALFLAEQGVASTVLEAEPALRRMGSKACTIQGDVLEILERIGCGETLAAEGVPWHVARTYVRGDVLSTTVFPVGAGFPPYLNVSQHRTQQVMLERLAEGSPAEVRWAHRVAGVAQDAGGVDVEVETPDGARRLRFAYLVACDGIHSDLRHLTGVEWTGYSHGDRFLSTDIRAVLPLAHERHFHYDHPANPGRQVVMHAQPDNLWRVDWQLPADTDVEAERRTDRLDRRIRATIGDVPYEIDWLSTYRFNQRVVERMRLGRILFAGDAAHALPPYGARGMNSGIQDADNLAWKLALVLDGRADEELLQTYHVERHAAARENLRVTEATIRFMVPPGRLRLWARNTLLRLAPPLRFLRARVNAGRMAEPFVYADSPIVDRARDSPLLGRFAPDATVSTASGGARLRTLLGGRFTCLHLAADAAATARLAAEARSRSAPVPLQFCSVLPAGARPPEPPAPDAVAWDDRGEVRAAYGAGWCLVRPDGHVAAAGDVEDGAAVADALVRCSCARGQGAGAPALVEVEAGRAVQ